MENPKNIYGKMCPCGCLNSFEDQEIDFIKEFDYWFLTLNWQQGFLGRTLLFLKTHKTDEAELTDEEAMEKHKIYCWWREAMDRAFQPDKINQSQLGNEEHLHGGHIHWHFIPRYRRPITFAGVEFQSDTEETQKLSYSRIADRTIHPGEVRQKIKAELLKHIEQVVNE